MRINCSESLEGDGMVEWKIDRSKADSVGMMGRSTCQVSAGGYSADRNAEE